MVLEDVRFPRSTEHTSSNLRPWYLDYWNTAEHNASWKMSSPSCTPKQFSSWAADPNWEIIDSTKSCPVHLWSSRLTRHFPKICVYHTAKHREPTSFRLHLDIHETKLGLCLGLELCYDQLEISRTWWLREERYLILCCYSCQAVSHLATIKVFFCYTYSPMPP